ncbi:MAG: GntR family transcriptional regulator [Chloroflexi bacterium]|nr:GntR family transcriptional regulator [Chloroflexota bacterium]MCL5076473.1 GntR family transcriptional regulator [Chloroflexota bacterium]
MNYTFVTEPLPDRIKEFLFHEIREGRYRAQDRLPAEEAIARELGVSRPSVRDALTSLEKAGFVIRRPGVGTFINRKVLKIAARLDIEKEFWDLLLDNSYKPEVILLELAIEKASPKVTERLELPPEAEVLKTEKVWLADGVPAIYCIDRVPTAIVRREYDLAQLKEPIFTFLEQVCGETVSYEITEIIPEVARDRLAEIFQCPSGTPIQIFEEVGFNENDIAILYSEEFYAPKLLRFKVVRTKV